MTATCLIDMHHIPQLRCRSSPTIHGWYLNILRENAQHNYSSWGASRRSGSHNKLFFLSLRRDRFLPDVWTVPLFVAFQCQQSVPAPPAAISQLLKRVRNAQSSQNSSLHIPDIPHFQTCFFFALHPVHPCWQQQRCCVVRNLTKTSNRVKIKHSAGERIHAFP